VAPTTGPYDPLRRRAGRARRARFRGTGTTVGYIIATPLYVVVGLKAMRLRSWPTVLLTAAIYTLVTYVVFAVYMRVNLPVGPLTDLFRSVGLAR
jgi:hypothetical protein